VASDGGVAAEPVVVERVLSANGELVLRRAGDHHEIIHNGVFLMDTRGGASERLLVRAALAACGRRPARLLIGGLGVGFSLDEALRSPDVAEVTVVELEQAIIDWHATHLRAHAEGALLDPRTRVIAADLVDWLRGEDAGRSDPCRSDAGRFDAVCLDIDNGPDWTVTEGNAALYGDEGLALVERRLVPGGALAIWSAMAAPAFEARLRRRFTGVRVELVEVPRGEPDHVYVATRRR